jgi:hypothetical protein
MVMSPTVTREKFVGVFVRFSCALQCSTTGPRRSAADSFIHEDKRAPETSAGMPCIDCALWAADATHAISGTVI